ncbi:RmlC-like cupins superfamily protein [Perilla frutescens var. frutescens]|nr:RmlC-like cupins superfamily protein [Perilla frutescens var. frutescens]
MGGSVILLSILSLNFFSNIAFAFDPSPLQDFCVADLTCSVRMNGYPCIDPAKVEADNFFFGGLHLAGNTSNPTGSAFTAVTADQIPGLNTQGLALARIDFEANGFLPPHFHGRAAEIVTVLEGSLEVGFVTSYPNYKHYSKVVKKGDVFVFPFGLVHYLRNVGAGNVVAMAMYNSQNPGLTFLPHAVLGANPGINAGFLSRVFVLDKKIVEELH